LSAADALDQAAGQSSVAGDSFEWIAASVEAAGLAAEDAERKWNPFLDGLQKAPDIVDAVTAAFNELDEDLGQLDAFDDILDQFDRVAEAQKKAAEGGEAETRDYNREVRRLQGQIADFAQSLGNLPPKKLVEIEAAIRSGDIDILRATLDELTKDRWINVGVRGNPQQAFSSIGGTFSPTQATPIINNPNPAPTGGSTVDNRNITIIYPVGSTPTTQYIDSQTDYRRNGIR
jgi:hypothetical protein